MDILKLLSKKVNDISIKKKLVYSYLFVVILPVLIVGIILTNGMNQTVINYAMRESNNNAVKLKSRMNEVLNIGVDISERLYTDKNFQDIVSTKYIDGNQLFYTYRQFTTFDTYLSLYKQIKYVQFYTFNPTMLENWQFMKVNKNVLNSNWYKGAMENGGKVFWSYIYNPYEHESCLSLSRLIKGINGQNLGVLNVGFNKNSLSSISQEPFNTLVVLDDSKIVNARDNNVIGKNIKSLNYTLPLSKFKNSTFKEIDYKGAKYFGSKIKFKVNYSSNYFSIISYFYVSELTKGSQKIILLGFSIIIISIIIAFFLIEFFANAISHRINKLSQEVDKVIAADFDTDISIDIEGNDEIGRLCQNVVTMSKNFRNLVYEVYEMDLQKKTLTIQQNEIQFKMLVSQINPHFLFNALESVRMKAHNRGEKDIAHILKLFGKMMRRNLQIGKDPVMLENEIDHVKSYLEIQKFRFGDRIDYEININSDISSQKILPFTLQPLVENAFVHGLEDKKGKGKIIINVKIDDFLKISIQDNGNGIEESKLQSILKCLKEPDKNIYNRIGIRNVYKRFELYYGSGFKFDIISAVEKGTTININLPLEDDNIC